MFDQQSHLGGQKLIVDDSVDGFIIYGGKIIGKGSQGICCECTNPKYQIPLCVKIIKIESNLQLYQSREPEIIEQIKELSHKNVVKVFHITQISETWYIFMERCKEDLDHYLKRLPKSQITADVLIGILNQVVSGYKLLYDKNIFHRDLKSANLLIGHDESIKISDFGLGKILGNPEQIQLLTAVCTPYFASPQILLDSIYSIKSDIFSLGIVIYKAAYERHPYMKNEQSKVADWALQYSDLMNNIHYELEVPDIEGTDEAKKTLITFFKQSLALLEDQRVSWNELFLQFCGAEGDQQIQLQQNDSSKIRISNINIDANSQFLQSKGFQEMKRISNLHQSKSQVYLNDSRSSFQSDTTPAIGNPFLNVMSPIHRKFIKFGKSPNSKSSEQPIINLPINDSMIETKKCPSQFNEKLLIKLLDVLLAKADFSGKVMSIIQQNFLSHNSNNLVVLDYYLLGYRFQILNICMGLINRKGSDLLLKEINYELPKLSVLEGKNISQLIKLIKQYYDKIEKDYQTAHNYMNKFFQSQLPKQSTYLYYQEKAQFIIKDWLQKEFKSNLENKLSLFACILFKFSQIEQLIPIKLFEDISIATISYVDESDESLQCFINQMKQQ